MANSFRLCNGYALVDDPKCYCWKRVQEGVELELQAFCFAQFGIEKQNIERVILSASMEVCHLNYAFRFVDDIFDMRVHMLFVF